MTPRRISPESLIELAVASLRAEIAPQLEGSARYQAAMVANALEIVRRSILVEGDQARFAVLDQIYDDGEGTLAELARDIRSGKVSTATHPTLPAMLRRLLIEEIEVTNPRALEGRRR